MKYIVKYTVKNSVWYYKHLNGGTVKWATIPERAFEFDNAEDPIHAINLIMAHHPELTPSWFEVMIISGDDEVNPETLVEDLIDAYDRSMKGL